MKNSIFLTLTVICAVAVFTVGSNAGGFEHGIVINVDGIDYYMAGPPEGPNGESDIPGHYWNQAGPMQLVGKHYNTGPFGAPSWWATEEADGALLYMVHAIIDEWSAENADFYSSQGYIHYHELATVAEGTLHPSKVVWLRHTGVSSFYLDGGPHPELAHQVTPGIDWDFVPNASMPYNPGSSLSQGPRNTNSGGFVHGIVIDVDGVDYYMDGPPEGPNGESDIPGHYWNQAGPMQLVGKHYNTGPFGASNWWATGVADGALLFMVHAIIDEWTPENAVSYSNSAYVHYHEIVTVADGTPHPTKVVWLRHTATRSFYFDGGPHPEMAHQVTPGIDWDFIPNASMPYTAGSGLEQSPLNAAVETPVNFSLDGAYPNPFNPTTTIRFSVPEAAKVNLTVYDLSGRQVGTLVDGYREIGTHEVSFDASGLSSGVYLYRLQSESFVATGKMTFMK